MFFCDLGYVSSIAGNANLGHMDGVGTGAVFSNILGIAFDDTSNTIYVGESSGLIRKIDSECIDLVLFECLIYNVLIRPLYF